MLNKFYAFLEENNLIMHEGTIIDGSFVEASRQRNTREENKLIKEDRGGLQHPDKPGLQPVQVRASDAPWDELDNCV